MTKYNLIFLTFFGWIGACFAQDGQIVHDGPYVFYHGSEITIKSLDSAQRLLTDSFKVTQKTKHNIPVQLDNHREWNFKVKLKATVQPTESIAAGADEEFIASDIEGEFAPFRNLLLAAKVIDPHYNWTFGKGKLIIAGDLFDRGRQVSQFLWLLYKLEDEAREKGGEVHVILGKYVKQLIM